MPKPKKKSVPPSKMTAAQKRVLVAKDAIVQLNAQRLVAKSGVYIEKFSRCPSGRTGPQVQQLVKATRRCSVCAKGAAAICTIRKLDGVGGSELRRLRSGDMEPITDIFPRRMLNVMEAAFEGGVYLGVLGDNRAAVRGILLSPLQRPRHPDRHLQKHRRQQGQLHPENDAEEARTPVSWQARLESTLSLLVPGDEALALRALAHSSNRHAYSGRASICAWRHNNRASFTFRVSSHEVVIATRYSNGPSGISGPFTGHVPGVGAIVLYPVDPVGADLFSYFRRWRRLPMAGHVSVSVIFGERRAAMLALQGERVLAVPSRLQPTTFLTLSRQIEERQTGLRSSQSP